MTDPTFDHRDVGTPESAWTDLISRVPCVQPPTLGDHLVVLAAHPDDETLGAGGLIATAAAAGAAVTVIVATDGEGSHPTSPTHSPRDLACVRRREVYAAIGTLAPEAHVVLLGLPDGKLAAHIDELADAVTAAAADAGTHLATPWVGDKHPDHAACARAGAHVATRSGAQHWQYPIWAWHWATPDDGTLPADQLSGVRLDPAIGERKAAAMNCHVSQHRALSAADGDEAILSHGMLEHFGRDVEVFVLPAAAEVVSRAYFEELYAHDEDPWRLQERFYERRKRAALLAALTRPRFRRAFEPGCATGLLTAELARRCDQVVAWDIAGVAVEQSAARLADTSQVSVSAGAIPDEWPEGHFDLIVLSEVGYYCTDLTALATRVEQSLADDGVLVACHWRHAAPMHPHSAGTVHAALGEGHRLVVSHVEDDFLLQVWTRSGVSVAAAEGIVR
jgi:LmbE family N-acetylglucosaminyl deacetylase/SAM-dependent methyltransferase